MTFYVITEEDKELIKEALRRKISMDVIKQERWS